MPEERRQITADDLKTVAEGFDALVMELCERKPRSGAGVPVLTLSEFAFILRKADELAAKVGGLIALAECTETLQHLRGQ